MFEHSLIDLETKPQPRRRWLSLPIAVGLHVVGLSAFAFASYWNVGTVPEPQLNAAFFVTLPTPPPPAGGGGGGPRPPVRQEQRTQTPPATPNRVVQPNPEDVPDKPPTANTNTSVTDVVTGPGSEDPGPGGPCVVCPAGPGPVGPGPGGPGGPGVEPGGDPVDSLPLKFSVGMTRPEILHQVQPRYSELARRAGVQGTVIVEAVIDEQGQVTNVRVLRGLPMNLDRAAVEAIEQWRFKPAMMGGHPVKIYYTLTVNFTIQR